MLATLQETRYWGTLAHRMRTVEWIVELRLDIDAEQMVDRCAQVDLRHWRVRDVGGGLVRRAVHFTTTNTRPR